MAGLRIKRLALPIAALSATAALGQTANCMSIGPDMVQCTTPQGAVTNCVRNGPTMSSCTQVVPPMTSNSSAPHSDAGTALGGGLVDFINRIKENGIRKKVGEFLAKGQCAEAANYALEKGRLELGLSLRDYCASQASPLASLSGEQMAKMMADRAEVGVEVRPGIQVTGVSSTGVLLEIKLKPVQADFVVGSTVSEWMKAEACGQDWHPFFKKGGMIMIGIYDPNEKFLAVEFGDYKECGLGKSQD